MTVSVADVLKTGNLESIKHLGIEQVEKLWNTLKVKGVNGSNDTEKAIKKKCIEVLEVLYRKPWDETIFFKVIQMRLDICEENEYDGLVCIKRLFSEFEMACPFLPKIHLKRALELKGEFIVLKLKDALLNRNPDLDRTVTELIEVLVEYKKRRFSITVIGSKILELMKSGIEGIFTCGKQLEALIPECEEFKDFQVDLLNILTELTLERASNCKKTVDFSECITEAINLNVKSLSLKPNVMGYFEFLKLTKLQDPRDFTQAIDTCLVTLKHRIAPGEDVRGKLQIIRLIVSEGKEGLKKGIEFAVELFANSDISTTLVLDELLVLIEENTQGENCGDLQREVESFLMKFLDQIRLNKKIQRGVLETLLRLAEKNSTVKENYLRCEEILKVIKGLNFGFDENLQAKLVKCYLKLDKLNEAKATLEELQDLNCNTLDILLMKLELYLRGQDDFSALEAIENLSKDTSVRAEHFLILFNELKVRLNSEMKMKLLKSAQAKNKNESSLTVDILRGIVSLVYDAILECGLTSEYKQELESCFIKMNELNNDQVVWLCQVCWNLGVIHARAEDFLSAQFGFKWCQAFSQLSVESKREFGYKAGFYYLTAKICSNEEVSNEDYEILRLCELANRSTALLCLKIDMLLRSKNWGELSEVLRNCENIKFESLAEIVLRASEEIPLEIYRLVLEKLTESEFESADFDILRFAGLYRGLTTCALLQYPTDLSFFHSAVKMIKSSFGGYPSDETAWLCGTALEMGRQAAENAGEWDKAAEWTEMAMNLVYLINSESEEDKIIRANLQESIQKLFERIVNRN